MEETAFPVYFGDWLKRRRKELDLTQAELARRAGCSVPALRKIEGGERRPSKQLAGLLAVSLELPTEEQTNFIKAARGELNVERLSSPPSAPPGIYKPLPLPASPRGNLPGMLTAFIGREPELAALSELLHDPHCRLLTIVGPGGIGKTRLAIETACRHKELFPDGAWFVPLAPLSSSEYLIPAISDALNFKCYGLTDPRSNLLNYLRDRQILLIMDNTEHLLDGIDLFAEVLEKCPQVKLLVTSRERLNLLSEWVFEIQGLPVPPNNYTEQDGEYSSITLFLQSARRTQAGFEIREEDQPWVVRICQIMEGMPLGIELAAVWVGYLSCQEVAQEIERNLDFLEVTKRDLPERHRSLKATLDHSWNLLNPEEATILSRLSVFLGSFRREAAEEICGASLAVLSSLKDKSLLRRTDQGRYDLHELIHQYAALRLAEDPVEEGRLKDEHAYYFVRRLAEWEKALKSSKQAQTLTEMSAEIDNLRQAWQRLVTCSITNCDTDGLRNPNLYQSPLFSLSLFYELRSRNQEAVSLFGQTVEALRAASDSFSSPEDKWFLKTVLGHILAYVGLHNGYLLQYQLAFEQLEEAVGLLENSLARAEKAQTQIMLAWIFHVQGQVQKSIRILKEALISLKEEGDVWWYALAESNLAWGYLSIGEIREGEALYQKVLEMVEPGDLRLGIPIRKGLARARYLQHDYIGAEQLLMETLELSFELGSKRQTAFCYLDLGQVALATNRLEIAEMNIQEFINLISQYGESHELAVGLIYSGKCLASRLEIGPAREKFLKVVQIGRSLKIFHLEFWGLVNLARLYLLEGQPKRVLEMALILQQYSVEISVVQEDFNRLLADIQSNFSPQQVAAAVNLVAGRTFESLLV